MMRILQRGFKYLIGCTIAVLACVTAIPSWAAIAWVQGAESALTSATTQAITFGSSTTTGNTIICGTAFATSVNLLSAADTSGANTYTLLTETTRVAADISVQQFYATNITGGWTVLTATYQNSSNAKGVQCAEFSGMGQAGLDQQAGNAQDNPGTGTDAVTSGNVTTTAADEVLFTTSCCTPTTINVGTNYTYIDAAPLTDQGSAYRIVSSTGTYAGTWTSNGAADDFATRIATFRTGLCKGSLMLMGVGGC
mgnify:CR=1 FL=1